MPALLTYAYNSYHQLVFVDAVPNGLACKCTCPACGAALEAKNGGKVREHHFAHAHGQAQCEHACETALHLLAKEVLKEGCYLRLPPMPDRRIYPGSVFLRSVEIERYDKQYNIRPDAEGIMPDGSRLLVEFVVSHKVSPEKYKTIVENNLRCLEINLKYCELDKSKVRERLQNKCDDRKWILKHNYTSLRGYGSSSGKRNPLFDVAKNILKERFEEKDLLVVPFTRESYPKFHSIKSLKYDTCEVDVNYNGFHCDLLLYRSSKPDEGKIAIVFRGQRRRKGTLLPDGLRVIDIIISQELESSVKRRLQDGLLVDEADGVIFSHGWKVPESKEDYSKSYLKTIAELNRDEVRRQLKNIGNAARTD